MPVDDFAETIEIMSLFLIASSGTSHVASGKFDMEDRCADSMNADSIEKASASAEHIADGGNGKAKVLIIEDEPGLLECLCEYLEGQGYAVMAAANAKAGESLCSTNGVNLIIADLIMPGPDVLNTLGAIRSRYPSIQIAVMSGVIDWTPYEKALRRLNPCAVFQKPFKLEEIAEIAARYAKSGRDDPSTALRQADGDSSRRSAMTRRRGARADKRSRI
jgi:DNA-binding NtrC family response regulator